MSLLVPCVGQGRLAIWDGANAEDIQAECLEMIIVSDNGTSLVVENESTSAQYTAAVGDGILCTGSVGEGMKFVRVMPAEEFVFWSRLVEAGQVTHGLGIAPVPGSIALNATLTVDVPIDEMPSMDYRARAKLMDPAGLSITSIVKHSTTVVKVTVQASLLYLGGADLIVTTLAGA